MAPRAGIAGAGHVSKEPDEDDEPREDWSDVDMEDPGKDKKPEPVLLVLEGERGIVVDPGLISSLHETGYFGVVDEQLGRLVLHPEEIMIFAERKRLLAVQGINLEHAESMLPGIHVAWDEHGHDAFAADPRFMTTQALFHHFQATVPDFWEMHVVYRELKTRGYIVRRGVKSISHFRAFKKGSKKESLAPKYIYLGVFEGKQVPLQKLHEVSDYATRNRQELILAVVDRHMDISYYNVKKQDL